MNTNKICFSTTGIFLLGETYLQVLNAQIRHLFPPKNIDIFLISP